MFVDTHCHLYRSYYEDFDDVIEQIKKSEIYRVINNGCDKNSNIEILELVGKYDLMYGALGIHPESANEYTQEDLDYIEEHIKDKKIVAIGEIGLDFSKSGISTKEIQISVLRKILSELKGKKKIVSVHSRKAERELFLKGE